MIGGGALVILVIIILVFYLCCMQKKNNNLLKVINIKDLDKKKQDTSELQSTLGNKGGPQATPFFADDSLG